jgi:glycosyltransferase involved in cell wall biosynthesis
LHIVYLLLHDFRFASLSLDDFVRSRFHFSKEYARRMAKLGHDVKLYILSEDPGGKKTFSVDGYEIKAFGVAARFPPLMKFGNDHSFAVLRELDRDSPDVIHFHNYYLWSFPYAATWAKRKRAKLVSQYHGTDPLRGIKASAYLPFLRLCDRILVPTEGERRLLTKLHIPGNRILKIPSTGVDPELFHRVGPSGDDNGLLYVGRIPAPASYHWEKAPHLLLPIFRSLLRRGVKSKLVVAGDGPGLEPMKNRASDIGLSDSIEFLGQLTPEELPTLYSTASLTLDPIHMDDIEPSWGGTLQESLACGTPVVAFNNGRPGFRALGMLIPTSPQEAAQLLERGFMDASWRSQIAQEGPRVIGESCDWSAIANRLDSTYRELVSSQA